MDFDSMLATHIKENFGKTFVSEDQSNFSHSKDDKIKFFNIHNRNVESNLYISFNLFEKMTVRLYENEQKKKLLQKDETYDGIPVSISLPDQSIIDSVHFIQFKV